jgi:hypothetical protein
MQIRLNFEINFFWVSRLCRNMDQVYPSSVCIPGYLSGEYYMFDGYSGQPAQNIVGDQAVQRPARGEACRLRLLLYLRRLPGRNAVPGSILREEP